MYIFNVRNKDVVVDVVVVVETYETMPDCRLGYLHSHRAVNYTLFMLLL